MSGHYAESESSQSESKMDISETPTDSTGVSPLADERANATMPNKATSDSQQTIEDERENNENKNLSSLDNRIMRPELLLPVETMPQRQISERTLTLANSHPLMSPTNTDSDSEPFLGKCKNFPDVVPRTEQSATEAVRNTLNQQNNMRVKPQDAKVSLLRANSPDLLSSESDADVSQYLAAVESNFQSVSLLPNANNKASRKTKRSMVAGGEDISSLDSISNHSFDDDEDIEHNLASLSPSSSLIDGLDGEDDDDDECEGPELLPDNDDDLDDFGMTTTPTPHASAATAVTVPASSELPQYTADEERRDSRNWQKITLPDGRTREIDMRVIEPYKRVLSHGGYLKAGGQNAIVIFCACHLPDKSRADYSYVMDNLFLYVVKTLEQLVTDDYVLIYLHGGSNRRNVPPFPWLKRCYQLLDRRLRKSLKHMYLVHPTFWIKSLVWMARPFVSTKFWRKLVYVKSLDELGLHVIVEKAAIPEKVKQYDAKRH
ncbi:protein prune homolog 2 [Drosophila montana]|uniref:protein prune homolog 2 n=1 Tax=Drosophila montana TaxID=40370 RepID=UPI00313B81C9